MPKKIPANIDLHTGEILEEIEERVAHRIRTSKNFRHPFHRHSVKLVQNEPSKTHQSHAESCDINNIIRQFDRTGVLPPHAHQPQYADVSHLNQPLTDLINQRDSTITQYSADMATYQKKLSTAGNEAPVVPGGTPLSSPLSPSKPPINPDLD